MVTRDPKMICGNPASTAALRRDVTSHSQRRALRHPAGAMDKAASFGKKIREEIMDGTLHRKEASSRRRGLASRFGAGILAGAFALAVPAAIAAAPGERRVEVNRGLDRAKIENLQRWVNSGHEEWCKDPRLVAMDELRRLAPDFSGASADLEAIPLDTETASPERAVYTWSSPDGRSSYRVTVEHFSWLLPIAGEESAIVWIPTHAEIIAHH